MCVNNFYMLRITLDYNNNALQIDMREIYVQYSFFIKTILNPIFGYKCNYFSIRTSYTFRSHIRTNQNKLYHVIIWNHSLQKSSLLNLKLKPRKLPRTLCITHVLAIEGNFQVLYLFQFKFAMYNLLSYVSNLAIKW